MFCTLSAYEKKSDGRYCLVDLSNYSICSVSADWIRHMMETGHTINGFVLDKDGFREDEAYFNRLRLEEAKYKMLSGLSISVVDGVLVRLENPDELNYPEFRLSNYCKWMAPCAFSSRSCREITLVFDDKLERVPSGYFDVYSGVLCHFDVTEMTRQDLLDSFFLELADTLDSRIINLVSDGLICKPEVWDVYRPVIELHSGRLVKYENHASVDALKRLCGDYMRRTLKRYMDDDLYNEFYYRYDIKSILDQLIEGKYNIGVDLDASLSGLTSVFEMTRLSTGESKRLAVYAILVGKYDEEFNNDMVYFLKRVLDASKIHNEEAGVK